MCEYLVERAKITTTSFFLGETQKKRKIMSEICQKNRIIHIRKNPLEQEEAYFCLHNKQRNTHSFSQSVSVENCESNSKMVLFFRENFILFIKSKF